VYHRFRTRAELVAEIWLDTAEQFQAAWWTHASAPSASPGEVARFVVRWAREHRADATILLAHRQSDFLGKSIGKTLAARAKRHQLMIASQFRELAERWLNDRSQTAVTRVVFAVVDIPMAALRRALASGKPVEAKMQALVVLAADAVLSGSRVSRSRRSR
jgi:AcrR family transcriptional regulator